MEVPELDRDGQWVQGVPVVVGSQEQGTVGALARPKGSGGPQEQGMVMIKMPGEDPGTRGDLCNRDTWNRAIMSKGPRESWGVGP